MGLLPPRPEDLVDPASVKYFSQFGEDYADNLPESYNAVQEGKWDFFKF